MNTAATDPATAPLRALVTGGTGGIGRAICQRLAAEGHRVVVADLDHGAAEGFATALGPEHAGLGVDLTDSTATAGLPRRAAERVGGALDLIVNNAGLTDSSGHDMTAMPNAIFDRIVAVNLTAVTQICAAAPEVLKPGGTLVNIASGGAFRPLPLRGPYSATKAAVVALTRELAAPWRSAGLRICAVGPGFTLTPMVQALHAAGRLDLESVAASIPLGRLGQPSDIADAVALLIGPAGDALNGQTLVVDGGSAAGNAPMAGPARGTERTGTTVVLSHDHADDSAVTATPALAAVIDRRGDAAAEVVLRRARDLSRLCAGHSGRARNFALLFVSSGADLAAQSGLAMLARILALEWAPSGARVNALIWHGPPTEGLTRLCEYLTGPQSAFVTGQRIEGGHTD